MQMSKPLAIDLFCGLGGWTDGLLAEGYDAVGYDIEEHAYGEQRYPGKLVLQDVTTLHGSQFKDAALIVASPPCQEYSYMAMPWKLAKAKAAAIRADTTGEKFADLTRLFNACFRIQKEASFAAGRHIPMVVENVRGAIPWVGRSRWNFGSFHLWGDVPALMPQAVKARKNDGVGGGSWFAIGSPGQVTVGGNPDGRKVPGFRFDGSGRSFQSASVEQHGIKVPGMNWSGHGKPGYKPKGFNVTAAQRFRDEAGVKQSGIGGRRANGKGDAWFQDGAARHGSKSDSRKAASAMIAKIPLPLSRHIAATFRP